LSKETLLKILGVLVVLALVWLGLPEKKEKNGKKREAKSGRSVRLYAIERDACVERVIEAFKKESGIDVKRVQTAKEEVDVYWLKSPVLAYSLKKRGVLAQLPPSMCQPRLAGLADSDGDWCAVGLRWPVVVGKKESLPASVFDYADIANKDKGLLVLPTQPDYATYWAALFERLGGEKMTAWMRAVRRNGTAFVRNDNEAIALIERGAGRFVLLFSDRVFDLPKGLAWRDIDQKKGGVGAFLLPSVVAQSAQAPHSQEARAFLRFILSSKGQATVRACGLYPTQKVIDGPSALTPPHKLRRLEVNATRLYMSLPALMPRLKAW